MFWIFDVQPDPSVPALDPYNFTQGALSHPIIDTSRYMTLMMSDRLRLAR